MSKHQYASGTRFGRWTVLYAGPPYRHNDCWLCRCDCGKEKLVRGTHLRSGMSPSCGCLTRPQLPIRNWKHGMRKSAEFSSWLRMRARCYDPKNNRYHLYEARGIYVATEWRHDFVAFFAHVGRKPSPKHSIDRIDPNGSYVPGNVRWATPQEQRRNRRDYKAAHP